MEPLDLSSAPMLAALRATKPCPILGDKLSLFGQFIGSWEVNIVYYAADNTVARKMQGEWHFGWVLDGRAIQDVWIAPKRALRMPGSDGEEYGATLRFFDAQLNAWRSTWIGPVKGMVRPFIARPMGDEIILDGSFAEGVLTRWIFSDITPDTFHWRAVESRDGWKTHQLQQEMFAARQSTSAPLRISSSGG